MFSALARLSQKILLNNFPLIKKRMNKEIEINQKKISYNTKNSSRKYLCLKLDRNMKTLNDNMIKQ